jgi:hypothetical protein
MIMTEDILKLRTCQGDGFYSVKSDFTPDYTKITLHGARE